MSGTLHDDAASEGEEMNFSGIITGVITFLIIGVFHPVIIKTEYYFGAKVWPVFLVFGLVCGGVSVFMEASLWSDIMGVLGCVLLWSIRELKQQEKRVARGWFPVNPNREV